MRARAVLLDIDGVLTGGGRLLPGAAGAIRALEERRIPFRLLTNATRRGRASIAAALAGAGLDLGQETIHTALVAAASLLRRRGARPLYLVAPEALVDLPPASPEREADTVFVGDVGSDFTMNDLNRAFRALHRGASLIAGHKNRFWIKDGVPTVDAGALVAALEYTSGMEAEVVGKPSPHFFRAAAEPLLPAGADLREVVMAGDRWETDVEGARAAGLLGLLVRTGLYEEGDESKGSPDGVIDSIADLISWLG